MNESPSQTYPDGYEATRRLKEPWVPLVALVILLSVGLPLFLCMPLWADASHYDICARNVLQGGVHYRDVFDTNLPGMVWAHAFVRSLLGWRSEALRVVDLLVVCAIVALLTWRLQPKALSRTARLWIVVSLFAFYLSTSEWCHCQRDTWMLLPALLALCLRCRQTIYLRDAEIDLRRLAMWAVVEGLCWGVAFWIKPFVAIPALVCWLLAARLARRTAPRIGRRLAVDAIAVLAGGVLAGALGVVWLLRSGAWPYFWDVFLNWNGEYAAHLAGPLTCSRFVLLRFFPWGLVHLLAVPTAVVLIGRAVFAQARPDASASVPSVLLAGFYLGWLLQILFFQHAFDYILVPPVLLGVALVAGQGWPLGRRRLALCFLACFLLLAALRHPLARRDRLALWGRCWSEGSSAELRDRLALIDNESTTDWRDLEKVRDWLAKQHLRDGELTCYHDSTHPLYLELGLKPSTRFLHLGMAIKIFPNHHEAIRQELNGSRHRYIVSDLRFIGFTRRQTSGEGRDSPALPASFPAAAREVYPWYEPIVFRAGRYVVHEVTVPIDGAEKLIYHSADAP